MALDFPSSPSTDDVYRNWRWDGSRWRKLSPIINVKEFGAVGDGATDDFDAITAALTAAKNLTTSVFIPAGTFITSQQIQVPSGVAVRGVGKFSSIIKAAPSFPIDTAVVRLGLSTDGLVFVCSLHDLGIDCSQIAGSIGVYGTQLNEGAGLFSVQIQDPREAGVFYDNTGSNSLHFANFDVDVGATNISCNYGFHLKGVGAVEFNRCTVSGPLSVPDTSIAGIYIEDISFPTLIDVNVEFWQEGILLHGDDNFATLIDCGSGGSMGAAMLHIDGNSTVVVINLVAPFLNPLLQEDVSGTTILGPTLPFWTQRLLGARPPVTHSTSPGTVSLNDVAIINTDSSNLLLTLPDPTKSTGRFLYFKSTVTNGIIVSAAANVVPLGGGAAQTTIIGPALGAWALAQSDGTNWVIIAGSPSSGDGTTVQFIAGATYTVLDADLALSVNFAGTCTLTLPSAASFPGRKLYIRTITDNAVESASSDVDNLTGSPTNAILSATGGSWTILISDGSAFWRCFAHS